MRKLILLLILFLFAFQFGGDNSSILNHFNELSGSTSVDSSGNGNTANLSGGVWVNGRMGGAIELNGSTDFVDYGHSDEYKYDQCSFVFRTWVYMGIDLSGFIFSKGYGPGLSKWYGLGKENGAITFYADDGSDLYYTRGYIYDEGWHYIECGRDMNTQKLFLYINGVDVSVTGVPNIPNSSTIGNTGNLILGRRDDGGSYLWCKIDEFYSDDVTSSLGEAAENYRKGRGVQ